MSEKINLGRLFKKLVLTGSGGVIFGFLLLVLVYLLPTEPMRENVLSSAGEWHDEGAWPILINGYSGSILDNFTDSIMQSIAIYDNDESVFTRAMKNYYAMQSPEDLPFDALYYYLEGAGSYGENYARYWHGYLVVLKPLLLIFNYSDLRMLNIITLSILTAYVTCLIHQKMPRGAAVIFAVSFLFLLPVTLMLCLDMANIWYVTMFVLIILLKKRVCRQNKENSLIYFFAVGMVTSYMDFLTYPMITLGLPLVTYIVLQIYDKDSEVKNWDSLLMAMFWGLGYGGMWAAKWVLASFISGENIILNALRTVKQRSDLQNDGGSFTERLQAVSANIDVLFQGVFGLILIILFIALIYSLIWKMTKYYIDWKNLNQLICVAIIPLIWLFVTSEHASIHSWFTYRNLVVSIYACGMLGSCANASRRSRK